MAERTWVFVLVSLVGSLQLACSKEPPPESQPGDVCNSALDCHGGFGFCAQDGDAPGICTRTCDHGELPAPTYRPEVDRAASAAWQAEADEVCPPSWTCSGVVYSVGTSYEVCLPPGGP